jgi:hypothetical protein
MVLSALVKYWRILHYHKCKVKYIEMVVMKVVLIRVIKGKIYWNGSDESCIEKWNDSVILGLFFFFANGSIIMGRREYISITPIK